MYGVPRRASSAGHQVEKFGPGDMRLPLHGMEFAKEELKTGGMVVGMARPLVKKIGRRRRCNRCPLTKLLHGRKKCIDVSLWRVPRVPPVVEDAE